MKKFTAILFLSAYLLSTTEAYQLLKLPIIFQHFAEHKRDGNHITFLQFLDMHYMHGSPRDADYEEDMRLPFKTSVNVIVASISAYVSPELQFTVPKPILLVVKKKPLVSDQFIMAHFLSSIWQPPKSC